MRVSLLAIVSLAVMASGCSGGGVSQADSNGPGALRLPSQVVGLQVQQEDVRANLDEVERPYVDGVAIFSLRDEDLLRATLQVAHFNRLARPEESQFRGDVLATIGGQEPVRLRVADTVVTATGDTDQHIFAWFEGDGVFILSVARDFEFPRTLLRRILELDLAI